MSVQCKERSARDGHEIPFESPEAGFLYAAHAFDRHWFVPSDDAQCRRRWPTANLESVSQGQRDLRLRQRWAWRPGGFPETMPLTGECPALPLNHGSRTRVVPSNLAGP